MAGRNLTLTALRALDTRLQHLAGFVHRQVQQLENRAAPTPPPVLEPSDPDPFQARPEGPPAHWLERVRKAASGYLDPATSEQAPVQPFGFRAGDGSEEVVNPLANPDWTGEENPVETKPVPFDIKSLSGQAPKFSFRPAQQVNGAEKAPSYYAKGSEESREGEGEQGNGPPPSKRAISQRARIVFSGYGPQQAAKNPQLPEETGSPGASAVPPSSGGVTYSASLQYGERRQNRPTTGKDTEPNNHNLTGHASGLQPENLKSPKYDIGEDPKSTGQNSQNKPVLNYSSDRKSPSSQPGNSLFKATSTPGVNYQTSGQGKNPKVNFLPANQLQNSPGPTSFETVENNWPTKKVNNGTLSGEFLTKAPEYWNGGKDKETLSGRISRNISPFQNQVDINKRVKDYWPWPELPEETPVGAEADNWQLVRRKLEHLRRLDEEQRGSYGAGSLFN
ncbi:MAG: hypothetical protein J0I20_13500 [Chloroflexi bacterium]|nr:hypothetical protein [Chloroflexota bacterium]OJV92838.1 MAG: hypothetical protein BGO39_30250 [Chloroflexi bacterium 54-19]